MELGPNAGSEDVFPASEHMLIQRARIPDIEVVTVF